MGRTFLYYSLGLTLVAFPLLGRAAEPRTGFYEVASDPAECRESTGPAVFLNHDSPDPVAEEPTFRAQGRSGGVDLKYSDAGDPILMSKTGKVCPLTFVSPSMNVLGICSEFESHRGDARKYPANSMEAFDSALAQGFSGFELDVQISKDGVLVVSHDDKLHVATDCRGKISEMDWAEIEKCELKRSGLLPESRFLSKKSKKPARIVALGEVFEHFKGDPRAPRIVVDIKTKRQPKRLVKGMIEAMYGFDEENQKKLQNQITFISKSYADQAALSDVFPQSHIAYESDESISGLIDRPERVLGEGENCIYDTFSLNAGADYNWLMGVIKVIKERRIFGWRSFKSFYKKNKESPDPRRILGWTLNHKKAIRSLRKMPIDDVLTDFSMRKILGILYPEVSDEEIKTNIGLFRAGKEAEICQPPGEKGE